MKQITGIIETALYTTNLERAVNFYRTVLGFTSLTGDGRFHAFSVAERHVLLLFVTGESLSPATLPGGVIPPHDGTGAAHAGFSVDPGTLDECEEHLKAHGVEIESRMTWERGGRSLYFRDPDGHLLEFLTPGVWAIY
ncbi:MAG TPA: VOC family protein [Verrucomicrobiales bacterium]|jgi:catechol 2,3-dioxygenase-like lactoylglutathione lyase family enzyme|nr:VOC family protein [Verrucomicrobiales bacterium]